MTQDTVLSKLVKLHGLAQSASELGSAEEAHAAMAKLNRLLLKYELSMTDVQAAAARDTDPMGKTVVFDTPGAKKYSSRIGWREQLAYTICRANFCKFLVASGTATLWFVGRKSHREVAVHMFALVEGFALRQWKKDYREHKRQFGASPGYKGGWFGGFISELARRLQETETATIAELGSGTALVLRVAEYREAVTRYVEETVKGKAHSVGNRSRGNNVDGRDAGRRAAHAAPLSRGLGAGSSSSRGAIGGGQ